MVQVNLYFFALILLITSSSCNFTLTTSVYNVSNTCDFGPNWVLRHQASTTTNDSAFYMPYPASSNSSWLTSYKYVSTMRAAQLPGLISFRIGILDTARILKFYSVVNGVQNQTFLTGIAADRIIFDKLNSDYAFVADFMSNVIRRIQLVGKNIDLNLTAGNISCTLFDFVEGGNINVAMLREFGSNTAIFQLIDKNLIIIKSMRIPSYNFQTHKSISFDDRQKILIITFTNLISIWNVTSQLLLTNLTDINTDSLNHFKHTIFCNGLFFAFQLCGLTIFEFVTSNVLYNSCTSDYYHVQNVQCFNQLALVGAKFDNSVFRQIRYYHFLYVSPSTNNPINSNIKSNPPSTYNFNQVVSLSIQSACSSITQVTFSQATKKSFQIITSIAGITSATAFLKSTLRPFTCFLEDFWFYGFHFSNYTEFVELFTKQIDILNQLRIKPQFLNFEVQSPKLDHYNDWQIGLNMIQSKAPDSQYMLQSIKDIYTVNLAISLSSLLLTRLVCMLLKICKEQNFVFRKFYRFLSPIYIWWSLMITFFETNIAPIVFYASLQFNAFVCFDQFSKLNLIATLLMFFAIQTYVFLFYPLIFQFRNRRSRKKVSDFGKGTHLSYWLEMCLKCWRSYFQALLHGIFINHNLMQLLSLVAFDISFLIVLIALRRMFSYKTIFLSTVLYFALLIIFDATLSVYLLLLNRSDSLSSEQQIYFQFATMIIILSLFAISVTKIVFMLFVYIYEILCCKNRRNNKINQHSSKKTGMNSKKQEVTKPNIIIFKANSSKNNNKTTKSTKNRRKSQQQKNVKGNQGLKQKAGINYCSTKSRQNRERKILWKGPNMEKQVEKIASLHEAKSKPQLR